MGVLYAVGMTETGTRGVLQPYALNIEGKSVITESSGAAMKEFRVARRKGKILVDLGCMQVNHHYHGMNFASPDEMLDPEKNIIYAARLLKSLYVKKGDWAAAVALYHASPRKPRQQRAYTCAVIANLVRSGFGRWTADANDYCRG